MGCTSSNQAQQAQLEEQLQRQREQLKALKTMNSQLKTVLESIQATQQKPDKTPPPDLSQKVAFLEEKINQLEKKLEEKEERDLNDTFSRGSRADSPPDILLESKALESAPQSEARSSHTIMDDPMIREMYEKKRQMFMLKKNKEAAGEQDSQPQISPTMTSTYMSNKPA